MLWSPKTRSNHGKHQPYINMTRATPGDVVFSFADTCISFVGVVDQAASSYIKPSYAKDANWADDGWLLPVTFSRIRQAFRPREHMDLIRDDLPKQGPSPLQANGDGTMNYLSEISSSLAFKLLRLGSTAEPSRPSVLEAAGLADDEAELAKDASIPETERIQILRSRVGQGVFRSRVASIDPICRVTNVADPKLLRASHIKPWRDATNYERLDGFNGLMLAPHIDHLFDKHLISFSREGMLLVSKRLSKDVRSKWNLYLATAPRQLSEQQEHYMSEHRRKI
ncbi:HNH endonuclease [Luteibacter pinisoli]|nr:HNH endonuclease signature motif containing protein [Luteibacter pinisoli]